MQVTAGRCLHSDFYRFTGNLHCSSGREGGLTPLILLGPARIEARLEQEGEREGYKPRVTVFVFLVLWDG